METQTDIRRPERMYMTGAVIVTEKKGQDGAGGSIFGRGRRAKRFRRLECREGRAVGYKMGEAVKVQCTRDLVHQEKNFGFYSKSNEKP